ncbi:MAG TPA: Ig-like domain-containing protein [Symbiobacteriaceae bacterium]
MWQRFPLPKSRLLRGTAMVTAAALVAGAVAWGGIALASDTKPPAPPTDLKATPASTEDGVVELTWKAPRDRDVSYYQIFRVPEGLDAQANEITYLGRTDRKETKFADQIPTEGTFRYAVIAVDKAGNASQASDWVEVQADFPENGLGTVTPDMTAPEKPAGLEVSEPYTQEETIDLLWDPSEAPDLWRYIVYRTDGTGQRTVLGYVSAEVTALTDTVPGEGTYTYTVIAQDRTGNPSPVSDGVTVVVDRTAPAVAITTPVDGQTYGQADALTIQATITETGAGYEADAVAYYLDEEALAAPVIDLSSVDEGLHTLKVVVTDRAGNTGTGRVRFFVDSEVNHDLAPRNLKVAPYHRDHKVTLTWEEPQEGDVDRYVVHRIGPDGQDQEVASLAPAETRYTDTVPADGEYTYYVIARHTSGAYEASFLVTTVVDTTAPEIAIMEPADGERYSQDDVLAIAVIVEDKTAGYDPEQVAYYLDGQRYGGDTIDLANLSLGSHTFTVKVQDRAGNRASWSVTFQVVAPSNDGKGDKGHGKYGDLIKLLAQYQDQIHHGHYKALLAKLKAGNLRGFVTHVVKFRGKFISPEAADALLEAVDSLFGDGQYGYGWDKGDKDDDDDDDRGCSYKGKDQDKDDFPGQHMKHHKSGHHKNWQHDKQWNNGKR